MIRDELFRRACRVWQLRCERENLIHDWPSEAYSDVDMGTGAVVLRNCRGELARFRYHAKSNRLRWVEGVS